jgi:hypothetical protein
MTERPKRADEVVDALLADIKAQPRTPASPLGGMTRAGRGGYFVVATSDEVATLDLAVGPVSDEAYPHRYEPAFVAEIGRCAAGGDSPEPLRCVASGGGADLFAALRALAELTGRPDFSHGSMTVDR